MYCHYHQALWTVGGEASYLGFSRECKHTPVLPSENHTGIGEKKWKVVRKSERYGTSRDNYSWLLLFGCEVCIQRTWVSMGCVERLQQGTQAALKYTYRTCRPLKAALILYERNVCLILLLNRVCVWDDFNPVHVKKKKKVSEHIYYFRLLIWNVRSARAVFTAAWDVINTC